MNCRGCGGDAIGLLDGESVCGGCAAMVSFAEKMAEERAELASWDGWDADRVVAASPEEIRAKLTAGHQQFRAVVRRRMAATWSRHWSRLVEVQRLNDEWLFYARAREAAGNGGCRT